MVRLSAAIQDLLTTFDSSIRRSELSGIALATYLILKAALQGARMVDKSKSAAVRKEMQQALGSYLKERIGNGSRTNAGSSKEPR